uniref:Uncharacterized protein n=1 Tax=Strombidinopsis acuminata TaxID=141414 RepID=A0A7S3SUB7_9SPIT|mmetsp:Transcript_43104/g.58506  ORF Transcript_43104/g.58506 Transcript_43104/m.58506 type:complete len:105 (+) Transcript_43104:22-336(+)
MFSSRSAGAGRAFFGRTRAQQRYFNACKSNVRMAQYSSFNQMSNLASYTKLMQQNNTLAMTNLQLTMINIDMQQAFIAIEEEENAVKDSEETGEDEDDGSRVAI